MFITVTMTRFQNHGFAPNTKPVLDGKKLNFAVDEQTSSVKKINDDECRNAYYEYI